MSVDQIVTLTTCYTITLINEHFLSNDSLDKKQYHKLIAKAVVIVIKEKRKYENKTKKRLNKIDKN